MFRKNLKIRTLRFKTERIYTGIRMRRAAHIHLRKKVNGYGAEKYPIERICSGILEILTFRIADFLILKVGYPTSNGKITQKTSFSSPQILNGYAPEYVLNPSIFFSVSYTFSYGKKVKMGDELRNNGGGGSAILQ